jgi:sugar/nucleoside kinase (ribokinase family)
MSSIPPLTPDLIVVGQVTIDDVVPASPGSWTRQIGGSALYAVAGARLWLDPARIALVARVGEDYPFDVEALLRSAGVLCVALSSFAAPHLVEWLIYEPDGTRRSLPRNAELLPIGAEGVLAHPDTPAAQGLLQQKLLEIAPSALEIPAHWLPAQALHLCPQVGERHGDTLRALQDKVRWISVDPSPYYARLASIAELAHRLKGTSALLASAQDISALLHDREPRAAALALERAGFAEVVIKRGGLPLLLAYGGTICEIPAVAVEVVDPTGAGDAFCGAYSACRLLGYSASEAARRAAASAALVVGCRGVEAALRLKPPRL